MIDAVVVYVSGEGWRDQNSGNLKTDYSDYSGGHNGSTVAGSSSDIDFSEEPDGHFAGQQPPESSGSELPAGVPSSLENQLAASLSRLGARHGVTAEITGKEVGVKSLPRPLVALECRFFLNENQNVREQNRNASGEGFSSGIGGSHDWSAPEGDEYSDDDRGGYSDIGGYGSGSGGKYGLGDGGRSNVGVDGQDDLRPVCRRLLGQGLAEMIISRLEQDMAHRIMITYYGDFSPTDRDAILEKVETLLGSSYQRQRVIAGAVADFLTESNEIHLDGFLAFRLPDYRNMLEEAVDEAVDDYLLDEEYREFIHLLKYFVDAQDPKLGLVHVLADGNTGSYRLVDEQGDSIDSLALEEMIIGLGETEINQGDLLVSALISLAPQQIFLHRSVPHVSAETVDTLRRVFDGRVYTCRGCSTCRRGDHHGH